MKIRQSIFLLCVIVIALAIFLVWQRKHPMQNSTESDVSPKLVESTNAAAMQSKTVAMATPNHATAPITTSAVNVQEKKRRSKC